MMVPGNSTVIGCTVLGRGAVRVRPTKMRWMKNNEMLRGSVEEGSLTSSVVIEVNRERATVETIKYTANFTESDDGTETTLLVNRIGT